MNRPRLGFYMSSPLLGGAETLFRDIVAGVDRDEVSITVFRPPWPAFDAFVHIDGRADVNLVDVPVFELGRRVGPGASSGGTTRARTPRWARRGSPLWNMARSIAVPSSRYGAWALNLRRLEQVLERNPVDLLHIVNGGYPGAVSAQQIAIAAAKRGIPVVMTVCSTPKTREFIPPLEERIDRSLAKAVDVFTLPTHSLANLMTERRGIDRSKIRVIPFGVHPPKPYPAPDRRAARAGLGLPSESPIVGMLSNMTREKGFDVLIEALPRVRQHLPDVCAVLCGDGPWRSQLDAQVDALGLASVVRMPGRIEFPADLYAAADVIALPSDIEGLPFVILEAMCVGRPVVATAVGGIPDAVTDGETGYLVPPRDAKALADALVTVLSDPSGGDELGRQASARFDLEFTQERMRDRNRSLYRELLER